MLTWSNWKTEPRSNRYHMATRFARCKPVFFVEVDGRLTDIVVEHVDGHDIRLVRMPEDYGAEAMLRLQRRLRVLGAERPLLWVYNAYFASTYAGFSPAMIVYHATEAYFTKAKGIPLNMDAVAPLVQAAASNADLVIAVSEAVADSYRRNSAPRNGVITVENGCDFEFWKSTHAFERQPRKDSRNVALYQGGINVRMDFNLLDALTSRLPDWRFVFCGLVSGVGDEWRALLRKPNVEYRGYLSVEEIAALAKDADLGLIPFIDDPLCRVGWPLKGYEYLACGLPVVSVRIDALAVHERLFTIAEDVDGYEAAMRRLAPTRTDPDAIRERLDAAAAASYDSRFKLILASIDRVLSAGPPSREKLNLVMLYDDRSTHVSTIKEHLESFQRYSRHNMLYCPATINYEAPRPDGTALDFSWFDALLIHYSVRVSMEGYFDPVVAEAAARYKGPKILFIQDEYDETETARRWIERLGVTAVFTNVPDAFVEAVYPSSRFPGVEFVHNLTGYVTDNSVIERFVRPLAERPFAIGYRGRDLPHQYGELGREKHEIGIEVKKRALRQGLPVDIEVSSDKRIYGDAWYEFLGSARATLGTESGSNVFDFDGEIGRRARENPTMSYARFAELYLRPYEGRIRMNQISPKIFEAIRMRTALVLFEGEYSGVVTPDVHFIPLKKDYSNIDDVFRKVSDDAYIAALTERAYTDVIQSGRYSYKSFIEKLDAFIGARAGVRARGTLVMAPAFISRGLDAYEPATLGKNLAWNPSTGIIGDTLRRTRIAALSPTEAAAPAPVDAPATDVAPIDSVEAPKLQAEGPMTLRPDSKANTCLPIYRGVRAVWRLLPTSFRAKALAPFRDRT